MAHSSTPNRANLDSHPHVTSPLGPSHPAPVPPSRVSPSTGVDMHVGLDILVQHIFSALTPVLNDCQTQVANGFDALGETLKAISYNLNEVREEVKAVKAESDLNRKELQDISKRIDEVSRTIQLANVRNSPKDKVSPLQPRLDEIYHTLCEMVEGIGDPSAWKPITHEAGVNTEEEQTQVCLLTPGSLHRREASQDQTEGQDGAVQKLPSPESNSRATSPQRSKTGKKIHKVSKALLANALQADLRASSTTHAESSMKKQSGPPPTAAPAVVLTHEEPPQPEPNNHLTPLDSTTAPVSPALSTAGSQVQVQDLLFPPTPPSRQQVDTQLPSWQTLDADSPLTDIDDADKLDSSDEDCPITHPPPATATLPTIKPNDTSASAPVAPKKKKRKAEAADVKGNKRVRTDSELAPSTSTSKRQPKPKKKVTVVWPPCDVDKAYEAPNQVVNCDGCSRFYHPPCVGLLDDDARLRSESFFCPFCVWGQGSLSASGKVRKERGVQYPQCSRPGCEVEIYYEERVLGRRQGKSNEAPWLYLVKWKDYGVHDCTWEPMVNFNPTLVDAFYEKARREGISIESRRTDMVLLKETNGIEGSWRNWD